MAWKPEMGGKAALDRIVEIGAAGSGTFSFCILEGVVVNIVGQKTKPMVEFEDQPRDMIVMVPGFPFMVSVLETDLRETKR